MTFKFMTFVWHVFKMQNILLLSLQKKKGKKLKTKRNLIFFFYFFFSKLLCARAFLMCACVHTAHACMYALKRADQWIKWWCSFPVWICIRIEREKFEIQKKFSLHALRILCNNFMTTTTTTTMPKRNTNTNTASIHPPTCRHHCFCYWLSCVLLNLNLKFLWIDGWLDGWMSEWMVGWLVGWSMLEWNFLMLIC